MIDIQLTGFEMQSKLGQGGMATVWKARQISLDRTVAIKILSSHFASDPTDIQRFQQEAQSAAKLKHPGIVQVYDANIENGLYFFVMEFVDGYTCADWLKRKETLTETDVLLIAECVADSLGYAWERERMIHCDIKPDNIMVDEDGTVKVTDLGLSRTISGMSVDEESEEILGTPAYMAPEQAMGEANPDCRLDMYALGAMMYHLSTGKLLFEGLSESEVMASQVSETVENPKDINPSLSMGFCRLVEVLMAKDKEHRPSDWDAVRTAISRIKKGLSPRMRLPEGAVSTVRKSVHAEEKAAAIHQAAAHAAGMSASPKKKSIVPIVAGVAVLLLVVGGAAKLLSGNKRPRRGSAVSNGSGSPNGSGGGSVSAADQKGRQMYYRASNWEKSHRGSYDEAISRFEAVVSEAAGTKYAERAQRDVERLRAAKRENGIEQAVRKLRTEAAPWVTQHQYDRAISIYENYTGEFASETLAQRNSIASTLRRQKADWERQSEARRKAELEANFSADLDKVAALAVKGDYKGADSCLEDLSISQKYPEKYDEIGGLRTLFTQAAGMDARIIDSFAGHVGSEVVIRFVDGPKKLRISGVQGDVVQASEEFKVGSASASRSANFGLDDLAVSERLTRMGNDSDLEVALVKGVMAYQSRAFEHARRYFQQTHPLMVERLLKFLDKSTSSVAPVRPDQPVPSVPPQGGHAEEGVEAAGITAPAENLSPEDLESAKNIDVVVDGLLRVNRELDVDNIDFEKDDEGIVRSIRIRAGELADISPLSSLKGLREFRFDKWGRNPAELSDISPLADLPMQVISIEKSSIPDIRCLKDLKLRVLRLTGSPLRDISPLRGMPLEDLDVSGSKVYDYMPVSMMKLKRFAAGHSQIKSIGFLRNMPLEVLDLTGSSIFDFSPISNMRLKELRVSDTQFGGLAVIRASPLVVFEANSTRVTDISTLKGCAGTLRELHIGGTSVRSFTTLKDLDLDDLSLWDTEFNDISLITHMKLERLYLQNSKVTTLQGLDSSKLSHLNIERTGISSIAVLRGAPLEDLYTEGSRVRNYLPVYGSGIRNLSLDHPASKWSVYSELPRLRRVNGQNIHGDPEW